MNKKNQRQIRKNQIRHDLKRALKHHRKLDRIASGGGKGADFPIGSNIPCPSCYELFQKEWPRQRFCSLSCRKDKAKLDKARDKKAKGERLRLGRMAKRGRSPSLLIIECKRCEHPFVKEHSRQEYCITCGLIMSTSTGRKKHEDATIDRLVEERMVQEGWGER